MLFSFGLLHLLVLFCHEEENSKEAFDPSLLFITVTFTFRIFIPIQCHPSILSPMCERLQQRQR